MRDQMSSSSCWMSRIFTFTSVAVVRFGWFALNYSTFAFNFVSMFPTVLHYNSIGCNSCIGRSRYFFPVCNPATLMTLSFPECNFSTVTNFQCPRFLLSPLIITVSPVWMSSSLSLWFTFYRSLKATRYSRWNLFHAASLHFNTYFCRFLKIFLSSSDVTSVGKATSRPNEILFDVNAWCEIVEVSSR